MRSAQYEELCRVFLSDKLGLPLERIQSILIPNPQRPGLPEYKHQIDLYWETETELSVYLHIANAKWRAVEKVDQPEVLLLQHVKQKVAAHKALMITSTGFTAGAKAAAQDEGIALHVVTPAAQLADLPTIDRPRIQQALRQLAESSKEPIYSHTVEYRAFDEPQAKPSIGMLPSDPRAATGPAYETRIVTGYTTRATGSHSNPGGGPGTGSQTRSGGSFRRGGGSGHGN